MAIQWQMIFDDSQTAEVTIEMTNWAGRFAQVRQSNDRQGAHTRLNRLDTIGRAAFSHDFGCLNGQPHALVDALDSLTNHEKTQWTFYMRALFWLVPWILHFGEKGNLIRKTRKELGELAMAVLSDAKISNDPDSKSFMSLMRTFEGDIFWARANQQSVREDISSMTPYLDDEQVAAQMRTIISAGYEPVSATISVSKTCHLSDVSQPDRWQWLFYELAMDPERQEAIRNEVSIACDPTYDALNNDFPLLHAFFMETLRMHPPVLENHHQVPQPIF